MVEFEDILHLYFILMMIYLHCVIVRRLCFFYSVVWILIFNVHHIHKVLQETLLIAYSTPYSQYTLFISLINAPLDLRIY